jgi:hypothetical protein
MNEAALTGPRTADGLLAASPLPTALEIPADYDRSAPDPREQGELVRRLAGDRSWADRSWSALIEGLLALGRSDIPTARLCEGHIDAVRILAEAGAGPRDGALYGVWAARSHATGVRAKAGPHWLTLEGTLRFASGAGVLDRALVPVWLGDDTHLLVDLDVRELPVTDPVWAASAMAASRSATLALRGIDVLPSSVVGEANFYLEREGFFAGGVGVAAVWAGGAARVADLCLGLLKDAPPSPLRERRLGCLRTDLAVSAALVRSAGARLDAMAAEATVAGDASQRRSSRAPTNVSGRALATEVRMGVADAVTRLLGDATALAGAAGIAFGAGLSQAIGDLGLYVLQRNADADATWLGHDLLIADGPTSADEMVAS